MRREKQRLSEWKDKGWRAVHSGLVILKEFTYFNS